MEHAEAMKLYFGELPSMMRCLEPYLDQGRELRFFEGESLQTQAGTDFTFYIKSGAFRLFVRQPDLSETDFAYCHSGCIIQLNPLLTNAMLWDPAQCIATKNSIVVSFTKQQFFELISHDQQLLEEYVNNSSSYSSLLKQRLLITAGHTASQRLLLWLDKLCQCSTPDERGIYTIPCDMSQQQIAYLLFIHVTTCSKLFSKLKEKKIVTQRKGKIVVYDYQELKNHLENDWKL